MFSKKILNIISAKKLVIICTYVLIALIPVLFIFGEMLPISKWNDGFTGLYLNGFFYNQSYLWNYTVSAGLSIGFYSGILFPQYLVNHFFDILNIQSYLVQAFEMFSVIFLSLLGVHFLVEDIIKEQNKIKYVGVVAFIVAAFYLLNFYTLFNFFYKTSFYIFILPVLPWTIFFIRKMFDSDKFIFIFLSALVPSISTVMFMSPAYGIINYFFIFLSVIIFFIFSTNKKRDLRKLFIFLLCLLFFNIFWLIPAITTLGIAINHANKISPSASYFDISTGAQDILQSFRLFMNKDWMLWRMKGYLGAEVFYHNPLFIFSSFIIPIVVFIPLLLKNKFESVKANYLYIFLFALAFVGLFLSKEGNAPLGFINRFLVINTSFFRVIGGADKFPYFLMVIYCILLTYFLIIIQNKIKNNSTLLLIYFFIVIIITANSFSFFDGRLVSSNIRWGGTNISSYVKLPDEYYLIRSKLEKEKLDYKLLFLPLVPYDMPTFNWEHGYLGDDFRRNFFNRGSFSVKILIPAGDLSTHFLDASLNNNGSDNIISENNIKYAILHYDMDLKKGNYTGLFLRDPNFYKKLFANLKWNNPQIIGKLNLFNNTNNFLQHFYTSQDVVTSSRPVDSLPAVVFSFKSSTNPVVYLKDQNVLNYDKILEFADSEIKFQPPVLEFKKINPIKYRIVIHGARGRFPLVFSESFDSGWKMYQGGAPTNSNGVNLRDYKVLDGNTDDQAAPDELSDFVSKGFISSLGDGKLKVINHQKWENTVKKFDYSESYKIDFVSKKFKGTIQNDNLSSGSFYETWFTKPLTNGADHLEANGYANSWFVDADKICMENANCRKNPDGTYDFEVIVEFWPQRLFYIGLFISGLAMTCCFVYLMCGFLKISKIK